MRNAWLVLPLLLLVALALWWSRRDAVEALEPEPETPAAPALAPDAGLDRTEEARPGEAPAREVAAAPSERAEDPEPRAARLQDEEEPDRDEHGKLVVHVVDALGNPIHSAEVRSRGLRTVQNPGDWLGWIGPELVLTTDVEGEAVLDYPLFYRSSGGGWRDTSVVCFRVTHPRYVAQDLEAEIAPGEYRVVLQQGTLVLVSGWIESPANRVEDLRVRVSDDVELGPDAWYATRDGRMACGSMPPGDHALLVEHVRDGLRWHSEPEPFSVAEGDELELDLELRAPRRIEGRLDPRVPRPVVDGGVVVHVYSENEEDGWILHTEFEARVEPDGSFLLAGVRRGEAEIIGICEGWTSTPVGAERDYPQAIPADLDGPFVLAMQPTAALEVEVLGPGGAPLPGARVHTWPNVLWRIHYSGLFMDRRWSGVTDERGVARIRNLPPGANEGVVVVADGYRMPAAESRWGQERRQAWIDYVSGETARLTVRLEPAED